MSSKQVTVIGVGASGAVVCPPFPCISSYTYYDTTSVGKISNSKRNLADEFKTSKKITEIDNWKIYFIVPESPPCQADTSKTTLHEHNWTSRDPRDAKDSSYIYKYVDDEEALTITTRSNTFKVWQLIMSHGGVTLHDYVANNKLTHAQLLLLMLNIFHGLIKLYESDIVHQDLNVQNVLVDQKGIARIIDFDLAIHMHDQKSNSNIPTHIPNDKIDLYRVGTILQDLQQYLRRPSKAYRRLAADLVQCKYNVYSASIEVYSILEQYMSSHVTADEESSHRRKTA